MNSVFWASDSVHTRKYATEQRPHDGRHGKNGAEESHQKGTLFQCSDLQASTQKERKTLRLVHTRAMMLVIETHSPPPPRPATALPNMRKLTEGATAQNKLPS